MSELDDQRLAQADARLPRGADESDLLLVQRFDGSLASIILPKGSMFGWEIEQLKDLRPTEMIHPEDRTVARRARLWCATTGEEQTVHMRIRGSGGRWVWSECLYERVEFDGEPATQVVLRDASEMAMSQEVLSLVVGARTLVDAAADLDDALRESVAQVLRFVGFDRGYVWRSVGSTDNRQIIATTWVGAISSPPATPKGEALRELELLADDLPPSLIANDHPSREETYHQPVNVLWVPVVAGQHMVAVVEYETSSPISSTTAELVRSVFARLADSLHRKGVEQELDLVRQQLAAAFSEAPVGMALLSPAGTFERLNRALADLVERDRRDLADQRMLSVVHPDDVPDAVTAFDELLAGSAQRFQIEIRLMRPDDSTVWVLLAAASAMDRDGQVRQFIVQVTDISAQKAREFALSGHTDPDADPIEALDTYLQTQPEDASTSLISIRLGSGRDGEEDRIRAVGKRLRAQTRNNDFFAQVGPGHFVAVATGLPDDGGTLLEMIRQRFEDSVIAADADIAREVTAHQFTGKVRARDLLPD